MKGLIICGGSVEDTQYLKRYLNDIDLVICADRGGMYAKQMGIMPHLLLGDMDSIPKDVLNYYRENKIEMELFPSEKDMTDSEIAIWRAVSMGCDELVIMGAVGSRIDHSMANICMLKKLLEKNIKAVIVNKNNEIRLINDSIELTKDEGYCVSLLPLTKKVSGITTKGLYYSLNDGELEMGISLGVSNEFAYDVAKITIKEGLLLVIKSKD